MITDSVSPSPSGEAGMYLNPDRTCIPNLEDARTLVPFLLKGKASEGLEDLFEESKRRMQTLAALFDSRRHSHDPVSSMLPGNREKSPAESDSPKGTASRRGRRATGKRATLSEENLERLLSAFCEDGNNVSRMRSLDEVAEWMEVSPERLRRHLDSTKGMTFAQWRDSMKTDLAVRIISEGDAAGINEIAGKAGFTSINAFYRAFAKRNGGLSPSQWARLNGVKMKRKKSSTA